MDHAFITGITAQNRSYPTEVLLERGYDAHSLGRRSASFDRGRIDSIWTTPAAGTLRGDVPGEDLSGAQGHRGTRAVHPW